MGKTIIQTVAAQWNAPTHVHAFTTTRIGGVSSEPYDCLNLGSHVGDLEAHVQANRAYLIEQQALPYEPCWLTQVHGIELIELSDDTRSAQQGMPPIADGALTQKPKVVCAVLTADCLPLLLTNTKGDRVAALHVGWRGMAAGIIEAGVKAFTENPDDILAWAGPCIGPDAFEIGDEVLAQLGGSQAAYRQAALPNKLYADLYLLAGERLSAIGVDQYSHSDACTYRDKDSYFSYRRDGECGRMASVIWIDR